MEIFEQGYRLRQEDLNLHLFARYYTAHPDETFPYTPFWIKYDLGYVPPVTGTASGDFVLIPPSDRSPNIIDTGIVRPNFIIGETWKLGIYELRWNYKATETSSILTTIVQFEVSSNGISQSELAMESHFDIGAVMVLYE